LARRLLPFALVAVATSALPACDGCGKEKPYTPFGVASSMPLVPPSAAPAPEPSASAEPPKFAKRPSELAPPAAKRWRIGGRELDAPPGRVFAQGLFADFDGDQKEDTLVWTLPAEAPPAAPSGPGELWVFRGENPPAKLFDQPGFVPIGPDCELTTALAQTGPHSVTLDVAASCKAERVARSPVRGIAVLLPLAERPLILLLRAAAAGPGETLRLDVDSTDRDDDGRDDARVTLTVQSTGSARPASADVVWLDRAAGTSRDAREPARSLARGAGIEATRAKGKTTHKGVGDGVGNLRRLYAALCAESGVPRIFDAEGAPITCGDLKAFVDELASAEVVAALTRKDFVEALAPLARDGWYHAPISKDRLARLTKSIETALPRVAIDGATTLAARVARRGSAPRYAPLRFESDGSLLVQTAASVIRVTSDARELTLGAEAGVSRWPLEVVSAQGVRWTGVALPCERAALELTFSNAAAQPTRLLAPRPGTCRGGASAAPALSALSFQGSALEAVVAGSVVGPVQSLGEAVLRPELPGAPRSPDGRALIVATPLGLLVTHEQGAELWQGASLGDPRTLNECVVSNGHERAACTRDDRVLLIARGSTS
jgi:hypothetical protein